MFSLLFINCAGFYKKYQIGVLFFYFFLGLWLTLGNPFGISVAADQALAKEISRYRSILYPIERQPITVVLFNKKTLERLHEANVDWVFSNDWPISYDEHATLIQALSQGGGHHFSYPPEAIFYDVFLENLRGEIQDIYGLNDAFRSIKVDQGPPVYMAAGGLKDLILSQDIYRELPEANWVPTAWEGPEGSYPLYKEFLLPDGRGGDQPHFTRLPATQLYDAWCRVQKSGVCVPLETNQGENALSIQWERQVLPASLSNPTSSPANLALERNTDPLVLDCQSSTFSLLLKTIGSTFWRALGIQSNPAQLDMNCLPFYVVNAADIYTTHIPLAPPYLAEGEPYVVLFGSDIPSLNDFHSTPNYGKIAGVLHHAMALVNLMDRQNSYIYEKEIRLMVAAMWGFWLWIVWILSSRLFCLERGWILILIQRSEHYLSKENFVVIHFLRYKLVRQLVWFIFYLSVILIFYAFFYHFLNAALEGWLSMIALIPLLPNIVKIRKEHILILSKERK